MGDGTGLGKVTTADAINRIIGRPSRLVTLKVTDTLDEGCRSVLAQAPIAGLGFRNPDGLLHTTLVGGFASFARVESPVRVSFPAPDPPLPAPGAGASMLFLLPGIGETLRVNGRVADVSEGRVAVEVDEAWVHCARCVLRSGLWDEAPPAPVSPVPADPPGRGSAKAGPLAPPAVAGFLASSAFVLVSSRDGDDRGDTSPRGDPPGFLHILDGRTLAVPDRRGNKRADTFRNLMTCSQVSLVALVGGRDDVLHLGGNAWLSDDPALLSGMALRDKPPHAALVVDVERAEVRPNEALRAARPWDRLAHVDRSRAPDLMAVAARHLGANKATGTTASVTRVLSKGLLSTSPTLARRAVDAGYRKELKDEGY